MSTIRVPPNEVRSTTMPCGSARMSPIERRIGPERMAAERLERCIGLRRRDDRQELAFVGDVERIDAEQVAGPGDGRIDRQRSLVEHDRQSGVASELVADGSDATACRIS